MFAIKGGDDSFVNPDVMFDFKGGDEKIVDPYVMLKNMLKRNSNDHNSMVNNALREFTSGIKTNINAYFSTIGNELYVELVASSGVNANIHSKVKTNIHSVREQKAKPPIKKKSIDEIRFQASLQKITEIGKKFKDNSMMIHLLNHPIVEVRGLALITMIQKISSRSDANEIFIAIHKFLQFGNGKSFLNPDQISTPSSNMLADIAFHLNEMVHKYPFDGIFLAKTSPSIIWKTKYDSCLTKKSIAPRENQRNTLSALMTLISADKSFIIRNHAPPGAGKSSLFVPIANLFNSNNKDSLKSLYICAGQGIAGVMQIVQSFVDLDEPCHIISLASDAATNIITIGTHNQKNRIYIGVASAIISVIRQEDWLIMDEPTYGADMCAENMCAENMSLLAKLDRKNHHIILMGATIPPSCMLLDITKTFTGNLYEVSGSEDSIQISCNVRTINGLAVLPHTGSTSSKELAIVVSKIRKNPFFLRMYTINTICQIVHLMKDANCTNLPDINAIFNDPKNLNPCGVVSTVLTVLELLCHQTDDIVKHVSMANKNPEYLPFSFDNLSTCHIHSQFLIVDVNPMHFALVHFKHLSESIIKAIGSVRTLYAKYEKQTSIVGKNISDELRRKEKGQARDKHEDERDERDVISLNFPKWAQIGTIAHWKKFNSDASQGDITEFRKYIPSEDFKLCNVSDDIIILLLSGVGILSNQIQCTIYRSEVINRANLGQLAYVITDHTGCFGMNFQVATVIITEEFAKIASPATIEQAGGRLCRVGITYEGTLILPHNAVEKILSELHNEKEISVEAKNMVSKFAAACI